MRSSRAFTAIACLPLPRVLAARARAIFVLSSQLMDWIRSSICCAMLCEHRYVARIQGRTGEVHTVAYYIGIIDFLQEWTPTKISAYMIKKMVAPQPQSTVPPEPYGEQFRNFFEHKWVGDAQAGEGETVARSR